VWAGDAEQEQFLRGRGGINKKIKIGKLYPPIRLAKNKFLQATLRPSTTGEGNTEKFLLNYT